MTNYAHKKIKDEWEKLDVLPSSIGERKIWIQAGEHLALIRDNSNSDELVVFRQSKYSYVTTLAVPRAELPADAAELLDWDSTPYTCIAGYSTSPGREEPWIDRRGSHRAPDALCNGVDLIFVREFRGQKGGDAQYVEPRQEYIHLADLHFMKAKNSYCKYDENGDLYEAISISLDNGIDRSKLVTFDSNDLGEYLYYGEYDLVRMFDFTLLQHESFSGWGSEPEVVVGAGTEFAYRQRISGDAGYTRGAQIIRARAPSGSRARGGVARSAADEHVKFVAHDFRHNRIVEISTDPRETTNYFARSGDDRPFEMSPAFFRPEVLSKYKTDREKYTIKERQIDCRSSWSLRSYDVNAAGQVFAYICDLRELPASERWHWKAYNELPKEGISDRAVENDFKAEFVLFASAREELIATVRRWRDEEFDYWALKNEEYLHHANPPLTDSKEEWSESIMDLTKLLVEGFSVQTLRAKIVSIGGSFKDTDGSIALLEEIVRIKVPERGISRLVGLREAQEIRSKVKGHSGGSDAIKIVERVLSNHETYANHFEALCKSINDELGVIELAMSR